MSHKGFGQPQPSKTDKLVEQVVRYCQKRHPEALDQIFDNLPVGRTVPEYQRLNQQILTGTTNALTGDIDTLAWFCGYIASEINRSEDNNKPHHPITLLSKLLIKHGMQLCSWLFTLPWLSPYYHQHGEVCSTTRTSAKIGGCCFWCNGKHR